MRKGRMIGGGLTLALTLGLSLGLLFPSPARATPVQWPAAQGGNGHYYDWVPTHLSWSDARNTAAASIYQGQGGHLVSITSMAENTFFESQYSQNATGQTLLGWIGGFQDTTAPDYAEPAGGWRWVTGEPFTFTNWWTLHNFPDDFGGHQDFIRTQPSGSGVFWDDIGPNASPGVFGVDGYFIEYESTLPEPASALVTLIALPLILRRSRLRASK